MKLVIATALLAALCVVGVARSEVPMEYIAAGERSSITMARQLVVRSDAAWQQLWSEHAPQQPAPKVDFAERMVVGVFLGTRPTSGYSVRVVEVSGERDAVDVKFAEGSPAPGTMVMQVLTSPFCLVSVPTRTGEVRFERAAAPTRPFRRTEVRPPGVD